MTLFSSSRGMLKSLERNLNHVIFKGNNQFINFRRFVASKHSYSSAIETEMPSITSLSKKGFNLKDHRKYQNMLLANTKFYCLDQPLLGIKKDGSITDWALMPSLTKEEFDVNLAFNAKETNDVFDELEKAHKYEAAFERFHESIPEDGPLEVQYINGNENSIALSIQKENKDNDDEMALKDTQVDIMLDNILDSMNNPIRSKRRRVGYYTTSVLRKRRLKMNKHKYKKLRKRTRALRKRLNK
ncbi:hypothetical protein K502DRAFT_364598 [Neoconidiobolus thromboides FSU 785]|nr:hypothetical protein K502DRAFT_364598 [Neoconidiobolus thromboides FSU 785]